MHDGISAEKIESNCDCMRPWEGFSLLNGKGEKKTNGVDRQQSGASWDFSTESCQMQSSRGTKAKRIGVIISQVSCKYGYFGSSHVKNIFSLVWWEVRFPKNLVFVSNWLLDFSAVDFWGTTKKVEKVQNRMKSSKKWYFFLSLTAAALISPLSVSWLTSERAKRKWVQRRHRNILRHSIARNRRFKADFFTAPHIYKVLEQ